VDYYCFGGDWRAEELDDRQLIWLSDGWDRLALHVSESWAAISAEACVYVKSSSIEHRPAFAIVFVWEMLLVSRVSVVRQWSIV